MKTLKRLSLLAVLITAFSTITMAQSANATATASATIVTPITIANTANMEFGNLTVGAAGGTAIITPGGIRSTTGDVTMPATTGTVNAASFTVSGTANFGYSITLPAAATTLTSGINTMTVDTWISSPTPTGTITAGGTQVLTIGATLNVGGAQAAGTYTSGTPFEVTVNYN